MNDLLITAANLTEADHWMIVVGILVNVSCALLGCWLVLRRMSLMGDAISHAILPGLAAAFIFSQSRAILPMFLGAMAVGMLTAFLSQTIHRIAHVPEDASMGVVFTSLFAVGVIMITNVARHIDLDPGCVLYGLIEFVGLDETTHFGVEAPRAFWSLLIVTTLAVAFVIVLYKELKIVAFDPNLATTMGISATVVHYALMAMVAGTTVASFEAVGSILVVAMLIVPAAAAHLLTDRLRWMLILAAAQGVCSAVGGAILAVHYNTSVAGMMSVWAGGQFALALILAPRYGLLSRWLSQVALSLRVVREDILAMLYRWQEAGTPQALNVTQVTRALGGGLTPRLALWQLHLRGWLRRRRNSLTLSPAGETRAKGLVRSHRLWESYLAKHFHLPIDHLHAPAERMEHYVTPDLREKIAGEIAHPQTDPHGREIPQ